MKTILFLLLFVITINAQTTSDSLNLSGKYALQFQISENFKLSSLQGTILSGKYNFNNSIALRIGISGNYNSNELTRNEYTLPYETREQTTHSFEIKLQAIFCLPVVEDVAFFVGAGPLLNIGSSKQSIFIKDSDRTRYFEDIRSDQETRFIAYGLEFICGTEWFVKSNISLFPEIGFTVSHREEKYFKDSEKIQTITSDVVQAVNARLGVSLYF